MTCVRIQPDQWAPQPPGTPSGVLRVCQILASPEQAQPLPATHTQPTPCPLLPWVGVRQGRVPRAPAEVLWPLLLFQW